MGTTETDRIRIPPPGEVRRELAETLQRAEALKRLLRVSEWAATQGPRNPATLNKGEDTR